MPDEDEWLSPIVQDLGARFIAALPLSWKSARLILRVPEEDTLSHEVIGPLGATEFVLVGVDLAESTHRFRDECFSRGSRWKEVVVAVEKSDDDWHMKFDFSSELRSRTQSPQRNAGIGPAILDSASPLRPALSSEETARPQSPRG